MRASHRLLMFRTIYTAGLMLLLLGAGLAVRVSAQGNPGSAIDAANGLGVSDNKLGSVLFFNYYTSDASSSQVNTRISITNASPTQDIVLHLFYVDSTTCNVADAFLCLTRNQTKTVLATEFDPNVSGYLVVVAVDVEGRPVSFNYLAGDELIVAPTGHRFGLGAMAAARRDGGASPINSDGVTATMYFNGKQYDYLPYVSLIDNFPSQSAGVGSPAGDTRLYVYTPLSDMVFGDSSFSGSLFFLIYDDEEHAYSGQLPLNCYITSDKQRITSVRTSPNLNTIVPVGRTGWARFYGIGKRTIVGNSYGCTVTLSNVPLMGATATKVGPYNGGHNLRYATTFNAPGYSITIPIVPAPCGTSVELPTRDSGLCVAYPEGQNQ